MQRLFDLAKWGRLEAGEVLSVVGEGVRRVRLELSAPVRTIVTVATAGSVIETIVAGRDVVEFFADGAFEFSAYEGLFWYTADGQDWSVAPVEDTTFTKIVERRVRNPEVEYMMALAQQNMEKRLAEQAKSYETLIEASVARADARRERADRLAAERAAAASAGSGGGASVEPTAGEQGGDVAQPGNAVGDGGKPGGK